MLSIFSAYIEITNICNLNCASCYNRSGLSRKRQELSRKQLEFIFDRLINEFSCKRISLSGGEPTLHSEFGGVLECLKSKQVEKTVVTNGTTNSEILKNAFNTTDLNIQISLDGASEETNSKTRGKGNFEKVLAFLGTLKKDKQPALKTVVSNNNICDVTRFFDLCSEFGCIPEYAFIAPMGNATEAWEQLKLSPQQKLHVLITVDKLRKMRNIPVRLPLCTSSCPLSNTSGEMSVLIKNNGDIFPCQLLYGEKFRMGNILTSSKEELYSSFKKISQIARQRENTSFGCEKCIARPVCKGGCMAFGELNTGDPLGNDGDCGYRKLQLVGYDIVNSGVLG